MKSYLYSNPHSRSSSFTIKNKEALWELSFHFVYILIIYSY